MFNRKFLFILALIFTMVISLSAVSAADNIAVSDANLTDNAMNDVIDVSTSNVNVKDGTFTDLQKLINNHNSSDPLYLNKNYTYNPGRDYALKEGIKINSSIVIIGNGHSISGADKARIFDISGDSVSLSDITFKHGYVGDDVNGSAILLSSNVADASITNCIFRDNAAGRNGGAIFSLSNKLTVDNCTFINNRARVGGAICTLNDVNTTSRVTIINSKFVNNTAGRSAGSIFLTAYSAKFINCTFDGNSVKDLNAGALYVSANHTFIYECTFKNNHATGNGGALYLDSEYSWVINSNFTDNDAGKVGGACEVLRGLNFFGNCSFTGNNASLFGGAVYIYNGSTGFGLCDFSLNTALNGSAVFAGIFGDDYVITSYNDSEFDLYFYECTFSNNNASSYGAIWSKAYNNIIDGCTFNDNYAHVYGGAVFIKCNSNESSVMIDNSSFYDNCAGVDGGALFITVYQTNIFDSNFIGNGAKGRNSSKHGGAAYIGGNAYVNGCTFKDNYAAANAGALYLDTNYAFVVNSTFTDNNAGKVGGAILVLKGIAGFWNCSFTGNDASLFGGAVYIYNGSTRFGLCDFSLNTALNGSAIFAGIFDDDYVITSYNDSEFDLYFYECTFSNNNASSCGTIWSKADNNIINKCTFNDNYVHAYGGAVFIKCNSIESYALIANSSFYDNCAGVDGGALFSSNINRLGIFTSNFTNNSVKGRDKSYHGGAAYINGNAHIKDSTFNNNSAIGNGGALYMEEGTSIIEDCEFTGNFANSSGSAIFFNKANSSVINSKFDSNVANVYGTVRGYDSKLRFETCEFTYNCAVRGAAIYIGVSSNNTNISEDYIVNCNFENNFALKGIIYNNFDILTITGSNIANNIANSSAGIYSYESELYVTTTRFVGNDAMDVDDINVDGGEATIKYCWFGLNLEPTASLEGRVMNSTPITIGDYAYLSANFFCTEGSFEDMDVRAQISLNYMEEGVEKYFLSPYGIEYSFIVYDGSIVAGEDEGSIFNGQCITNSMELIGSRYIGDVIVDDQVITGIIPKRDSVIIAYDMVITAYDTKNLVITLKDALGTPLYYKKVTFTFNGKTYTKTTDGNGVAKLPITSSVVKSYPVTIKYDGSWVYKAASKTVTVKVNAAYVTVSDIIKSSVNVKKYVAKNKKLPNTVQVGSVKCTLAQYSYLASASIKALNAKKKVSTKIKVINVKATNKNTKVSTKATKKQYLSIVNSLYSKGAKGTLPSYITVNGKKVGFNVYTSGLANILSFYNSNKRLPNYVIFTSKY